MGEREQAREGRAGSPDGGPAHRQRWRLRSPPSRARERAYSCSLLKTRTPLLDCYRSAGGYPCVQHHASLRARARTCVQDAVEARKITGARTRGGARMRNRWVLAVAAVAIATALGADMSAQQ